LFNIGDHKHVQTIINGVFSVHVLDNTWLHDMLANVLEREDSRNTEVNN